MQSFTVADMLERPAFGTGSTRESVALRFQGAELTYAELDARTSELAAGLQAHGFAKGDRAAILLYNRIEWVELFFAIAKLGGVVVPINYFITASELAYILDDCGARWVVSEEALWEIAAGARDGAPARTHVAIGPSQPDALDYEALFGAPLRERPAVGQDDLLLLQYTSGTTGRPKGAVHTHATVLWNSYHQIPDFGMTEDDVVLVIPALCWAAGFHDFALAALMIGATMVLNPSTKFDPAAFAATVERERVTHVLLVPTVLRRVVESGVLRSRDLSSLRIVATGGEPVPPDVMEAFEVQLEGADLVQVFGMSELPTMMLWLDAAHARAKRGSTGKACSIARVRVVDPEGRDVEPGVVGEIVCRSPASTLGYYGKDDATADLWRGGWMHSGDLAHVDEDGFVFVAGRSKDMFISGGLNVYPAEIERALGEVDGVVEAAVVGVPDGDWGEVGRAYVVVESEDAAPTPDALRAALAATLAGFKIPKQWELRTEPLPRTTSGKLTKKDLRQPAA